VIPDIYKRENCNFNKQIKNVCILDEAKGTHPQPARKAFFEKRLTIGI
jgi:hypothetical protein